MQTSSRPLHATIQSLNILGQEVLSSLFFPATRPSLKLFSKLWLAGLFLVGLVQWATFLNFGSIPMDRGDWAEITQPRLEFLRNAILEGELPLHIPISITVKNATDRYLGLPDLILSPQVLLLRWLTPAQFVLVQVLLMVSLGYFGLLLIRKRFNLGLVPFTALFFLVIFNGHITAHLAVGHATWTGYFLIPYFILLIYDLFDPKYPPPGWRWTAKIALLMLVFFLQGSFHLFVWCAIFLEFIAICHPRLFKRINLALAGAFLLSAVRILPIALVSGSLGVEFFGGFLTAQLALDGLIKLIPINQSIITMATDTTLITWWEYDFYIGLIGLLFVLCFGLYPWKGRDETLLTARKLFWPIIGMVFLSLGRVYNIVFLLHIPLLDAERAATRFLILPLVFLVTQAAIQAQKFLGQYRQNNAVLGGGLLLVLILINDLQTHFSMWQVNLLDQLFISAPVDPAISQVINHADPTYTGTIWIGLAISTVSLAVILFFAAREKNSTHESTPA